MSIWDLVHRWDAWISEFEDGPFDFFEYVGMLEHRDDLAEQLALGGDQRAMDTVEELDERFLALTVEQALDRFENLRSSGWWWDRIPADQDALRYLLGDY